MTRSLPRSVAWQSKPDVTNREQALAAVERTVQELGRLDIVIDNARVMLLGPIVDAPTEEWDRMIELNLQGLRDIAHAALPHLLRAAEREPRRVADLVNVSSVAGRRVGSGGGIYQLTKHGVGTFSEALRQEVTARYVRSSLIEPGATKSELVTHVREEVRSQLPGWHRPDSRGGGHRRRDSLHRHTTTTRGDHRDPGPPDRAGALARPPANPGSPNACWKANAVTYAERLDSAVDQSIRREPRNSGQGVHAALRGMTGIEADIAAGERASAQKDPGPAAAARGSAAGRSGRSWTSSARPSSEGPSSCATWARARVCRPTGPQVHLADSRCRPDRQRGTRDGRRRGQAYRAGRAHVLRPPGARSSGRSA